MKKIILSLFILVFGCILCSGCNNNNKIYIGTMAQPGEPILESIKDEFEQRTGYKLEIVTYTDFITPNQALQEGAIDVNLFQHEPYLNSYNSTHGTSLVNACILYDCVYGAYSNTITSTEELKKGDVIAIADDSSNMKRCLQLLEANGLITLNELPAILVSTDINSYIKSNPLGLLIEPTSTSLIAEKLKDETCAIGIVNATYAILANLSSDQIVFKEADPEHLNANILATTQENLDEEWLGVLVELLTSEETANYITTTFKGTIIPYFKSKLN